MTIGFKDLTAAYMLGGAFICKRTKALCMAGFVPHGLCKISLIALVKLENLKDEKLTLKP
jgi:hypothetical protein